MNSPFFSIGDEVHIRFAYLAAISIGNLDFLAIYLHISSFL